MKCCCWIAQSGALAKMDQISLHIAQKTPPHTHIHLSNPPKPPTYSHTHVVERLFSPIEFARDRRTDKQQKNNKHKVEHQQKLIEIHMMRRCIFSCGSVVQMCASMTVSGIQNFFKCLHHITFSACFFSLSHSLYMLHALYLFLFCQIFDLLHWIFLEYKKIPLDKTTS